MDDPISPARRTLLKAGAATLATPVAAAIAQPAAAVGHQEAKSFDLWVISDQHVGTDKAASEGIQHGLVGFRPPPVRAESLATALRQSEEGGAFGGPPFNWDIALNLGDYAGFWDAPEDEQGREVVRQYSVLKRHRREQVYNIAGNHDASPHGHPANEGKETNWWFRKWCDPVGEHTETSGVDLKKRPYPIDGTWERYTFKLGNIRFLMMGDRNDLPYPVGRRASGGASPAGAVTPETFAWWTSHVESAGKDEIIITGAHHMLRETTVGSGDYEGVSRNPDGRRALPIYTSSATSRKRRRSRIISRRIPARSTSGLAATPIRIPTTCSTAVRMWSANGASISSTARSCRNSTPT